MKHYNISVNKITLEDIEKMIDYMEENNMTELPFNLFCPFCHHNYNKIKNISNIQNDKL